MTAASVFIYKGLIKGHGTKVVPIFTGNRMHVNLEDGLVAVSLTVNGFMEREETEKFIELIKPGMTVIDAGANIGYYSVVAAKYVGPSGKVISFEPDPQNYAILQENAKLNGYSNIIAANYALSDKETKVRLFKDGYNFGSHSLSESNVDRKAGFVEVPAVRLDAFMMTAQGNYKADIMKMDVEGAEGLVLGGARNVLMNNDLIIFMEFSYDKLTNMGTRPEDLLESLKGYGYEFWSIQDDSLRGPLSAQAIIDECLGIRKHQIDILLKKKKRAS